MPVSLAPTITPHPATRHPSGARAADVDVVRVCGGCLFSLVFLQKLAVPLGGTLQISILLPVIACALGYLLLSGRAVVAAIDLALLGSFGATAVLANLLNDAAFSLPSLFLLLTIYVFWTLRIPIVKVDYLRLLGFFQRCMIVIVAIEAVQYLAQVAHLPMPLLDPYLPDWLLVHNFNYVQEIFWRSGMLKANGIFMLEASFLSQFLALALVVEAVAFRRRWLMVLFGAAVLLTFSGTGLLVALLLLPGLVAGPAKLNTGGLLCLLAAGLLIAWLSGILEIITARFIEFSDTHASGSMRFMAPYERMLDTLVGGDNTAFLWGKGAGFLDQGRLGFAWNPPAKIWVEYGFITFLVYVPFCLSRFFRAMTFPLLSAILFAWYFFIAGGALLQPSVVYACFFLATGYIVADETDAAADD